MFYLVSSLYRVGVEEEDVGSRVLNLVLSGQFLILNWLNDNADNVRSGFKPYFIWLAPYTLLLWQILDYLVLTSFKPCFIWLAPYTILNGGNKMEERIEVLNLVLSGWLLIHCRSKSCSKENK